MSGNDQSLTDHERMQRDSRSTEELVEAVLACNELDDDTTDDYPAVAVLHARGTREVLDTALALCGSPDPKRRQVGVRVLGELGTPRIFPEECCDALLDRLAHEPDRDVLAWTIFALGHLGNRRSDAAVIALRGHPDPHIRHGVAFALRGATTPAAVQALLELMEDSDELVRDWATTGIGETVAIDGHRIRDALLRRTADSDAITRAEALHGLARRRDWRAGYGLIAELSVAQPLAYLFADAAKTLLEIAEETPSRPGNADRGAASEADGIAKSSLSERLPIKQTTLARRPRRFDAQTRPQFRAYIVPCHDRCRIGFMLGKPSLDLGALPLGQGGMASGTAATLSHRSSASWIRSAGLSWKSSVRRGLFISPTKSH